MSDRRTTTGESRKKSTEKKSEAKKRTDNQKRSGDNVSKVMQDVSRLGTTGFSDTDSRVMSGAERIGQKAETVGREDAKATSTAAEALNTHALEMERLAKQSASEGAKADKIHSSDNRVAVSQELRGGYKEAQSVASDIAKGDKQAGTTARTEAKSILERVKADSRKRPTFR